MLCQLTPHTVAAWICEIVDQLWFQPSPGQVGAHSEGYPDLLPCHHSAEGPGFLGAGHCPHTADSAGTASPVP